MVMVNANSEYVQSLSNAPPKDNVFFLNTGWIQGSGEQVSTTFLWHLDGCIALLHISILMKNKSVSVVMIRIKKKKSNETNLNFLNNVCLLICFRIETIAKFFVNWEEIGEENRETKIRLSDVRLQSLENSVSAILEQSKACLSCPWECKHQHICSFYSVRRIEWHMSMGVVLVWIVLGT